MVKSASLAQGRLRRCHILLQVPSYKGPARRASKPSANYTPALLPTPLSTQFSYNSHERNFVFHRPHLHDHSRLATLTLYHDGDHLYGPSRALFRNTTPTPNSTSLLSGTRTYGVCSCVLTRMRVLK
jgi:hypothetical protein